MSVAVLVLIVFMIVMGIYARSIYNQLEELKRQNDLDYQQRLQGAPPNIPASAASTHRRRSETVPLLGERQRFDIRA